MPDLAIGPDSLVPPLEHPLVHCRDGWERPQIKPQGAAMAEMRVAGEENRHYLQGFVYFAVRQSRCRSTRSPHPCTRWASQDCERMHMRNSRPGQLRRMSSPSERVK